jgi:uncharacterized protein (TIGR02597 family)
MKKIRILALATSLSILSMAHAVEVTTAPVGFIKFSIPGGTVATPSLSYISAPMYSNPIDVGAVSSVGASTISNTNATWAASVTNCSVHMVSGPAAGQYFPIVSSTPTQLTLDTSSSKGAVNLTALISAGNRYEVYPTWTFGSLFGTTGTTVPFLGASTPANADNILVQRGGAWVTYYWSGGNWRSTATGLANKNTDPIYKDDGIVIKRRSGATTVTVAGVVSTVAQQTEIPGNTTSAVANRNPIDTTVSALGLHNLPNWKKGNTASVSDKLLVINSSGAWVTYYHSGANWRSTVTGLTPKDTDVIPAGAGLYIDRTGTDTSSVGTFWTQTAP